MISAQYSCSEKKWYNYRFSNLYVRRFAYKKTNLFFLRDVNFDKNKFHLDKNQSLVNVEGIVKYSQSKKKGKRIITHFLPKRSKSHLHHPFVNNVKSSKNPLLLNVSLISLRCRTFDFFKDEFSKNYKFSIDDIYSVRFLKRHTKSMRPNIKARIPAPMTLTFFILLWPYFLMFREFKKNLQRLVYYGWNFVIQKIC